MLPGLDPSVASLPQDDIINALTLAPRDKSGMACAILTIMNPMNPVNNHQVKEFNNAQRALYEGYKGVLQVDDASKVWEQLNYTLSGFIQDVAFIERPEDSKRLKQTLWNQELDGRHVLSIQLQSLAKTNLLHAMTVGSKLGVGGVVGALALFQELILKEPKADLPFLMHREKAGRLEQLSYNAYNIVSLQDATLHPQKLIDSVRHYCRQITSASVLPVTVRLEKTASKIAPNFFARLSAVTLYAALDSDNECEPQIAMHWLMSGMTYGMVCLYKYWLHDRFEARQYPSVN